MTIRLPHVAATIIGQVRAYDEAGLLGVRVWLYSLLSDESVRVIARRAGEIASTIFDIAYDAGRDLYDVEIHRLSESGDAVETRKLSGIYFDQFPDVIR